jgi:hypothetical protein
MSIDVVFYVGAFIKFNKPVEMMKTTERKICPGCNAERNTKFCATCGAEIVSNFKTKAFKVTDVDTILDHVGYDCYEDDEKFTTFPYGDELVIPNYDSSYNRHIDREDVGKTLLFVDVDQVKENAITELREKAVNLLPLLDSHNVDYDITFGVTVFAY